MSQSSAPQSADSFAAYPIGQPLIADDDDKAGFRIPNERDPVTDVSEAHRIYLNGYDRANVTAVRGRLFHVIHGILGHGSSRPATLVIFEWLLVPGRLGRRFREVNINVTFFADGDRPGARTPRDLARFTPSPVKVAPSVPLQTGVTGKDVTEEISVGGKLMVGYAGFVEGGPEATKRTTVVTRRMDFQFVAGYPAFVKKTGGEPNSVHWTLRENASQESGLPSLVRTAVLVQRREGDHRGLFKADIKTSVKASVVGDGVESLLKLVGMVPKDDPVYFDPNVVEGLENGAAVLNGSRDVKGKTSPVDKNNLAGVNLDQFLVFDSDKKAPAHDRGSGQSQSEATNERGEPLANDGGMQVSIEI